MTDAEATDAEAFRRLKAHKAGEVYAKYQHGDSLADDEVEITLEVFKELSEILPGLGPVFLLASMEAIRVRYAFQWFHDVRRS